MSSSDRKIDHSLIDLLAEKVTQEFGRRFGRPATVIVAAPGRVNLIGEHIDYNDGFVLPLALDRYVLIAADRHPAESNRSSIQLFSLEMATSETVQLDQPIEPGNTGWTSYVEGVIAGFVELGATIPGFDAVLGSNLPLGGGLSSSAALEVAMATLVEQLTGKSLERDEKALLCQRAEHRFAGVPCGIMDQFSSVFGIADELMLIDCRSQEIERVPFCSREISVLITNSNVRHELSGGEYAQRRAQCHSSLTKLNQSSWRNVSLDDVERARAALTEPEFRRARHVVSEIQRTIEAALAFRSEDWDAVGKLMYSSHDSLRDDFEVSCYELDILVEIASSIGSAGGVIGSRMTGGGFGGCTVSLVNNEQMESVSALISEQYESKTGITPHCFFSRPARGAHVIRK